ncbi:unnamed protein product [Adineta ricciae]|uniref:CCZ1/INTU/HSP4 first Longin domain-containing protein n=1 Tax=Adineta ricciae TaxID=249248 RepID=A0A814JLV9_ADIRI|nr:unnamed protein product [Adineta ricciae]
MTLKSPTKRWNPFFFILDFYLMRGASDENDVVPEAIIYFYPTDEQSKKQVKCGEVIGMVQYFQHDLFRSIPQTFYFDKALAVHKHFGRHSGFLFAPHDRYVEEEAQIHLKNIMNVFNMLYGTWNHVHATYGEAKKMNEFLNQALTPIVNYVLNHPRSVPYLLSTIGYTLLKKDNGKVLLECKHSIEYLKLTYGMIDGLLGYDQKILYSSFDTDTNYYLQFIFQLRNELPDNLICIPWDSEFKLKNGVSLFRLYLPRSVETTTNSESNTDATAVDEIPTPTLSINMTKPSIKIFEDSSTSCDEGLSSPLRTRFSFPTRSTSVSGEKRQGMIISMDQSASSEERGFDTDTMDESSSISAVDVISVSSLSYSEPSGDVTEQNPIEESLTDEQKLESLRSRSSTLSNDMEKTIEIQDPSNLVEKIDRIHLTEVYSCEYSDDENFEDFSIIHRVSHQRTPTVTSNSDGRRPEFLRSDRQEMLVSWTNIPDRNDEPERHELVLYVQRNSRMAFAGIMERRLLTDDHLKTLWNFMLTQMANMEAEIHAISTTNEVLRLSHDVKFQVNQNTHNVEFERISDGGRVVRKLPTEESAFMTFLAQTDLDRDATRKVVGFSRGNCLLTADRRLSDRTTYLSRRAPDSS